MRAVLILLATVVFFASPSSSQGEAACNSVRECAQQAVEAALAAREAHRIAVPSGAVMAFNLPKCPVGWRPFQPAAGRVVVGAGEGNRDMHDQPLTKREVGDSAGAEAHALSEGEMPAHVHTYIFTNHQGTPKHTDYSAHEFGDSNTPTNTSSTGGGKPHNNMPPFVVLKYCERI